ncbi:VOC family protein [Rurimicrobium arvi]|uniref:VOC family protein n=1 Tax=Rurimicrobium arvi TaxID=2049916 RepID=A0ABP8N2G6_9BACT
MQRVTGIGGIFFKCKDPEKMRQWYQTHLGIDMSPYGAKISSQTESGKEGYTLWTPFPDTTSYFGPSEQSFMINYRVADLEALVAVLKEEGVSILDELVAHEYGKFIHIEDIEGNKIELWEPAE